MKTGQINLDSNAGRHLYSFALHPWVNTIVEIGAWNGYGSTMCIAKAIANTSKILISLETHREMYLSAVEAHKPNPNVQINHGSIVTPKDYIRIDSLDDSYFTDFSREVKKGWLEEDIRNAEHCPNVLDVLPSKIDLLVLDGGEFSSWAEFEMLRDRCRYIFLDDTMKPCIKNVRAREWLKERNLLIYDFPNDRNGFCIGKMS